MTPISKDNPDKSTGMWCADCGRSMRHNVPRLGPAGGFVHADTSSVNCGPYVPPTISIAGPAQDPAVAATERVRVLRERIRSYLLMGGLVNPELMEHDKVSLLLQDIAEEMDRA